MSFKDGRIGVGKDPIFPLDISGSCRIDGDLILGGRFSDSQGNPIQLGSGSGATSTPHQNQDGVPSWSSNSLTTVSGYKNTGAHPSTISNGYNWGGSTWNDDGTITWSAGTGGTAGGMAPPGGWDANTTYILTVTSKTTGGSYTLGGTSFNPGTSYATQTKEFTGSLGEMRNNWGSSNQITFKKWDVSIKNKKMLNVHQLGGVGINDDRVYDEDFGHLYIDTTDFPTLRRGGKDYTSSSVLTVGGSIILSAINGTNSQTTSNIYFNAPNNKFQTGLIWRREVPGAVTYISGAILFDSELQNYSTTTTTGYSAGGLSFYTSDFSSSGWSSSSAKRRMVIHGDGNVGIGNSSPEYLLDLANSTYANGSGYPPAEFIRFGTANISPNSSGGLIWKTTYGGSYTKISAKIEAICEADYFRQGLAFFTGNETYTTDATERMRIDMDGNVGIGTTQPDKYYLNSSGTGGSFTGFDTILAIYGGSPGQTNGSPCVLFKCDDNHTASIYAEHTGNGNTYMGFSTTTGTAAPVERMRIDSAGNVGIGTTSPQSLLHLAGTGDVVLRLQADTNDYGEGDNPMIEFRQDGNLLTGVIGTGNLPPGGVSDGNDNALYIQHMGSNGIVFLSGPSQDNQSTSVERMRITTSGNVGIGTTSPTQGKLVVNGSSICGIYSMGDYTDYNYILNGPRPGNTAGGAVHFINHASRTGDGGQSCYTIRNDNGPIRLGRDTQTTTIEGSKICLNSNVGIGTTSPSYKLDMYNNGSARLARFQTTGDVSIEIESTSPNSDYDDCGIVWHGHASAPYWHLGNTDDEQWLCIGYQSNSTGSTGWGNSSEAISFHYDGRIWFGGSWQSSDDRIKNNEKTVTNALDIINKLQTKKYFKSNKMHRKDHNYILNDDGIPIKDESGNDITDEDYHIETGFIAQEVKNIPELAYCVTGEEMKYGKEYEIIYDENGNTIDDGTGHPKRKKVLGYYPKRLGVTYQDIFCYNVSATQELDRKVIALETVGNKDHNVKILDLYKENQALKARLAKIEAFLGI